MIKTFRGLLADGGQDRIRLSTIKGKVGYKIVKFNIIPTSPYTGSANTVKIYKNLQSSVPASGATIDFTDSDLLAVGAFSYSSGEGNIQDMIIFDNEVVNQDIYVTHTDETATLACNYYIEMEVIPLDDKGAEYMTIKDLRTRGF